VRGLSLPLLGVIAALAQLLTCLPVPLAHAASLSVTGTADIIANDGVCTLREAIINANRDDQSGSTDCAPGNGADEIAIPAGTYMLSITGRGEDAAATGDLDLTQSVTIVGAGSASTIIQAGTDFGSSIDRVFQVLSGVSAEFRDVTIGRGNASSSDNGGGIYNAGTTTINTSTLSNNSALAGGGIFNDSGGALTISSSTLSSNSAV
jgi:CSLREA domain-containing protein